MATQRIFPSTNGPATASVDDALNVGVAFKTNVTAWVIEIYYWRGTATAEAPSGANIWRVDTATTGTNMRSAVPPAPGAATGWQTVTLGTPVQLVANQEYRVSILYSSATSQAKNSGTNNYFTTGGGGAADIVNGFLTAPTATNTAGANQGSYVYSTTAAMPINSFNQSNYWIDVFVTDVDPSIPIAPTVDALGDRYLASGLPLQRTAVITPNGATVTAQGWTLQSGPGVGSPTTLSSTADLDWTPSGGVGDYVLRASATNSEGTTTQDITITVVNDVPLHSSAMAAMMMGR